MLLHQDDILGSKTMQSDELPYEERISLGTVRTRVDKCTNAKTDRVVCFS